MLANSGRFLKLSV